jgi:hypothetical protein
MYDTFKTIESAKKHYSRCRTRKDFILKGASESTLNKIKCKCCGKPLADYGDAPEGYRGNICEWIPGKRTKNGKPKVVGMHYLCAWGVTLNQVDKLSERM